MISEDRIRELEKAERKLRALENGGVDNWDGYDFAMEDIHKENAYEEFVDGVVCEILDAISCCIDEPAGSGCAYRVTEKGFNNVADVLKAYKLSRK